MYKRINRNFVQPWLIERAGQRLEKARSNIMSKRKVFRECNAKAPKIAKI